MPSRMNAYWQQTYANRILMDALLHNFLDPTATLRAEEDLVAEQAPPTPGNNHLDLPTGVWGPTHQDAFTFPMSNHAQGAQPPPFNMHGGFFDNTGMGDFANGGMGMTMGGGGRMRAARAGPSTAHAQVPFPTYPHPAPPAFAQATDNEWLYRRSLLREPPPLGVPGPSRWQAPAPVRENWAFADAAIGIQQAPAAGGTGRVAGGGERSIHAASCASLDRSLNKLCCERVHAKSTRQSPNFAALPHQPSSKASTHAHTNTEHKWSWHRWGPLRRARIKISDVVPQDSSLTIDGRFDITHEDLIESGKNACSTGDRERWPTCRVMSGRPGKTR
ncbi:uncharacterized protein BXZ73DRAFT_75321 [Epithele typhae]|uniref:uncharacterized protein n=1 Tax=Epithele typhae TaxID=378194 RepID=UPI002008D9E5|nr:uncharacterized protein BXZ73DRAFT_75321 [Epithele typhae]KAH9940777.1 hypothetical protein BXZ73DRAFT_75321 [Epithele typhae]